MNIFILNTDPVKAAQENCDKHVCKIILEVAQMLCLAHYATGGTAEYYAKTHMNNHVSKWVRETDRNYEWTVKHGLALCDEYEYRYGRIHACKRIIEWCGLNIPNIPKSDMTPFRQAVADDCYDIDPVKAYRKYYNKYKAHFAKWTKRSTPWWFIKPKEQNERAPKTT